MKRITIHSTQKNVGKYSLRTMSATYNAIQRLGEYEDAEEKGLLVRLPCPIGTTVYTVTSECEGDFYECYKTCFTCCNRNIYIEEMKFDFDFIDCVGEFVFLTREEAEAALKKMQEGKFPDAL